MRHRFLILALVLLTAACSEPPPSRFLVPVYFYQGHTVGKANRPTGLHASDDGGETFEAITWPELITNSVAVDASGHHYYLSCGNGVMICEDGGRNWRLTGGWQMSEVQKVAIDRRDPARAWAATAYGVFEKTGEQAWTPLDHLDRFSFTTDVVQDLADPDRLWVCSDTGLYATDDAGGTWREVVGDRIVRRVVQDPENHDRLLAATDGRGLIESTDGGKSFHRVEGTPDVVFSVALDGDAVCCGGMETFAASDDGGKTWRTSGEGMPEGFFVYGILVADGRIFVSGTDGVLKSTDRGQTWKRHGFEGALVPDLVSAAAPSGTPAPLSSEPGGFEMPGAGDVYDDWRPDADPALDARLAELREALGTPDPEKWPGWHKAALAFAAGDGDEALLDQLSAQLAEPKHSMFYSLPLIGLYLHAQDRLPMPVRDRVREIMTTVPVYRGDTENHWVMHYSALLLAAQTWPETPPSRWYTGRTSGEIYDEARGWLMHWARLTSTIGQGEFDSPNYMLMYVTPMLLLYDFAEDGEVKQMAGMMLDLLLADYFAESLEGAWCGGHSRIIGKEVEKTTTNRVAALHWLYAGGIDRPENIHPWLGFSALSTYRPPSQLAGIANDRSKPYVQWESKRVRNVLRFRDPLKPNQLNPTFTKFTYMTPRYAMGCLPGGILQPIQQHTWDVTWLGSAENSTLFTVHPSVHARELAMFFPEEMRAITKTITAQKGVYGSPDKLVSASPFETVRQRKNVLIAQYDVPDGERFPHVNLYWPDCLVRTEEGGWHFGRDGEFFLALFATEEGEWTKQEGWTLFRCPAASAGFVVVTRPVEEETTFDAFRAGILDGPRPVVTDGVLSYGGDMWMPYWNLFSSPFLTSPSPGVIRMTDGRATRTLDFNEMTIREEPMSTVSEFLSKVGSVHLSTSSSGPGITIGVEAVVGGANRIDVSVGRAPRGSRPPRDWVLFSVEGERARLAASHERYLYAFWRWVVEACGDRPVSEFERRHFLEPSFRWQRPVYDLYFSQSARSVRNLSRRSYVREMARAGFTHLEVNSLATPEALEKGVPGEVYPRFYTYLPALDQFVASGLNRGLYPKRYLADNLARLRDGAELATRYGLQPTLTCFEPRSVPEKLLAKYPELRGCRVDHPFRSFLPRYNLAVGHPVVKEHYRELMRNLMREVPRLSCLSVWTNDSGAGMEFTKSLYVGANGSAYLVREWSDDDVFARSAATNAASFLRLLLDAAAETNPDFRVVTRLEPFGVERPFLLDALGDGLDVEVPTHLATGWDSPYGHPTYPDCRLGPFTVFNNAFKPEETAPIKKLLTRDCRTHVMHAHGPTNNFEPLLGIPSPWLVHEKLAAMRAAGVEHLSHFGGIAPPASVRFSPNHEVFRNFQFDPESDVEAVVRAIAARFAGKGKARTLVSVWRLVEKAIRGFVPNQLYFLWGPWYRLWVRPLVPDIDAIPEAEREYYERPMLSTHHNPNRVDLSRDVLFHLMSSKEGAKAASLIDRRALPHLDRALSRLAGEDAEVFVDLRDRLTALRHWMVTRRNVAAWIAHVKGYLETTATGKRTAHRAALAAMVKSEIANARGLRRFLADCGTEVMAVSEGEETTFIYDSKFSDHLAAKIDLMKRYGRRAPRIDPDFMWRVARKA